MPERDEFDQPAGSADEAALAVVARHALHDEELVAALAARALDGEDEADERTRARSFVDRCPACRALHDDVAAIGSSLRADAAFTAAAPRDFRLTVDDAHRLGGTVVTRRVARAVRAMFLGIARPIGASLAALGLVGVLVGSAVLGSAGLAQRTSTDNGATTGGLPAALASAAAAPAPTDQEMAVNPEAPKASSADGDAPDTMSGRDAVAPSAASWILVISALAVIAGVVVFLIGARASRRGSPGSGVD